MNTGINRIRLEFKEASERLWPHYRNVLIESDWNLKGIDRYICHKCLSVLIESDWNLKTASSVPGSAPSIVLIESDWNLKDIKASYILIGPNGINRIRLEFKVF